jgi:hypothetical protein
VDAMIPSTKPVDETRRDDAAGALEELFAFCHAEMVEAQHGRNIEDAGRANAYARVQVKIREMQRARR